MKKIAFRISDEFLNHEILFFIQKILIESNINSEIFKINESLNLENFDGYILLTNSTDTLSIESDIIYFHGSSKPIVAFSESTKNVAKQLKKFKPTIAIDTNDSEILFLKKMGIETEICPTDDFITDRYTKILSSSLKLTIQNLDLKTQKGLKNLCKELVEMC